jgi:hypothetical protein
MQILRLKQGSPPMQPFRGSARWPAARLCPGATGTEVVATVSGTLEGCAGDVAIEAVRRTRRP